MEKKDLESALEKVDRLTPGEVIRSDAVAFARETGDDPGECLNEAVLEGEEHDSIKVEAARQRIKNRLIHEYDDQGKSVGEGQRGKRSKFISFRDIPDDKWPFPLKEQKSN